MKITKDGYRAHQLEHIVVPDREKFSDDKLYIVDTYAGFWRRLTEVAAKEKPVPEQIRVFFQGSLITLVPASVDIHRELVEAGLSFPPHQRVHPAFTAVLSQVYSDMNKDVGGMPFDFFPGPGEGQEQVKESLEIDTGDEPREDNPKAENATAEADSAESAGF